MAALELRIEKLEERIRYARARKASVALHGHDASSASDQGRTDSMYDIRDAIHRIAAQKQENASVQKELTAPSPASGVLVNATTLSIATAQSISRETRRRPSETSYTPSSLASGPARRGLARHDTALAVGTAPQAFDTNVFQYLRVLTVGSRVASRHSTDLCLRPSKVCRKKNFQFLLMQLMS